MIATLLLSCSTGVQTTGANKKSISTHRSVALLPFQIYLGPRLQHAEKFTDSEKLELQHYLSLALQQHLYEAIQKKQKRFPLSVNIQSVALTNQMLASQKISFAQLFGDDKTAICKLLGVDAIIFPQAIFGKSDPSSLNNLLNKGSMAAHFTICDSKNSNPLWTFDKELSDNVLKNNNAIISIPNDMPEAYYTAENKYQQVLVPWIPIIDVLSQNFFANFPYKK